MQISIVYALFALYCCTVGILFINIAELEAYAGLVTALRAQGCLNQEKAKILKDTCILLNITQDRHKAEIRRVVNDEKLNTIAYQ